MDMIVVMKAGASADDVRRAVDRIAELGLTPHLSKGEFRTIIGAIGYTAYRLLTNGQDAESRAEPEPAPE